MKIDVLDMSSKARLNFNVVAKVDIISKEDSYTFMSEYPKEYLKGILTKKEFEQIVLGFTKLMGKCIQQKRSTDKIELPGILKMFSLVAILLVLSYIAFLIIAKSMEDGYIYLIIGVICLSTTILILIVLSIYNFLRDNVEFIPISEIISKNFEVHLDQLNEKFLNKLRFIFNIKNKEYVVVMNIISQGRNSEQLELNNIKNYGVSINDFEDDEDEYLEDEDENDDSAIRLRDNRQIEGDVSVLEKSIMSRNISDYSQVKSDIRKKSHDASSIYDRSLIDDAKSPDKKIMLDDEKEKITRRKKKQL